ncbi:choice-of-anchor D domain-containing protein [Croceibacter atlanticus]|uniref:choice-of-anchor D domain-containing protein n=1 Tax=Croceibacter atlanticus TaxID=313588 RepID=UPI002E0DE526|nr:choice-of-anchor D domain-containing protein [Croceibacter atlanticus]
MKHIYLMFKYLLVVCIVFLSIQQSNAQDATANPSSIEFGNLDVGQQSTEVTFLTNNTSNNWTIIEFDITGPDANQFGQSNNPGAPFGPEGEVIVEANFNPTTPGNKNATLIVTYGTDFSTPVGTVDIPLSGSAGEIFEPIAEVTNVNFGTHDIFVNVTDEITLSNTGNADLVVSSLDFTTDANFIEDFSLESGITFPFTLIEGESRNFEVTFNAIAREQTSSPNTAVRGIDIQIDTNDPNNPTIFSNLQAEILLPQIEVQMSPFEFDGQEVEVPTTRTVDVNNTGDGTLVLSNLYFSAGSPSTGANDDFIVTDPSSLPFNIPGNSTYPVEVQFTPSATGERSTFFRIETVNSDALSSIFTRGFGQESGISITPNPIDFADVDFGSFRAENFSIENTGTADLELSSGSISGAHASDFEITTSNEPLTIGTGNTVILQVLFTPSGVGNRTATLTYTSNAPSSPHVIPLLGNGAETFIELSTNSIDFGDTNVGTPATQNLIISNTEEASVDLVVSELNLSGETTQFNIGDVTLPVSISPGNNIMVPITFEPSELGEKTATLSVVSDDDSSPNTVLLSGNALEALLTVNRAMINFQDTQIITNTRTELVSVGNMGNTGLEITGISFSGEDADDFSVTDVNFPINISEEASLSFQVVFAPQTRTLKTATMTIETSAGNADVALMGETTGPKLSTSGTLDFGTLNLTDTRTAVTSLTNSGESDLIIDGISVNGANASDFNLEGLSFPITLAPSESQEVNVTVNPSDSGVREAILQVSTNDAATVNQSVNLSANITNRATISFATNPFTFPQTDTGETTFSLIPVTNTGSKPMTLVGAYTFASDNSSIFRVTTYEDGTDIYPLEIAPGETKDIRFQFSPDGNQDSYATTAAIVTAQDEGPTTNFDFLCGTCIPSGYVHKFYTTGGANRAKLNFDEDIDGMDETTIISFPDTSIGRVSEQILTARNTGNLPLEIFAFANDGEFTLERVGIEEGESFAVTLQPNETAQFKITFAPEGDLGDTSGNVIIISDISNGDNGFTNHVIQVNGTRVEPEEVAVGGLVFKSDSRTLQPDGVTWLMSGNVHAGKLEYGGDVLVNTTEMTVTSLEEIDVFVNDIPEIGDFGGDRVLLQSGMIEQTVDNVDPVLNVGVGAAAASVSTLFTLVGIPVEISQFKLIDETVGGVRKQGIEMGGVISLPEEIFGTNANITMDRIRIDDVDGVNVMGSAMIAPNLKILNTFDLRNASINFDTFTNSFGGSAEVRLNLLNKGVNIAASIQIINGGLDSVSLEIEVSPGIPIANTGFSLAGGNGFIEGLQIPPLSLGLGVDIEPTVSPIDLRLNNMQVAYTLGTSLTASGTIQLYRQDIGGGNVTIKANGVSVGAFVNLYGVFKGNASMLVEHRNDELFFESTANLSITIPSVEVTFGCVACEAINRFLPLTVASVEATFNNTTMRGKLTVAQVLELAVALQRRSNGTYRTNFEANLGIFNLSFFNGQAPSSFNNQFYFENDEELQLISDGKEGASLVIPASSQSSFAPMDIPFTLNESARNIIVRVQGTSGTPDYILILPDGTEVTPTNVESLGYLATTYEEDNKAFYILQNTPVGEYKIRIDNGDTYEIDIYGAEFAPELTVTSVTQDAPNDQVTFTWEDEDFDSDANVSFYYDTDDKDANGNLIVEGISENDNTDSFTFNTSALKNGTYYIYGTINDDIEDAETSRAPAMSYGTESFTINRETDVDATTLFGELNNNIFELSWSPIEDAEFYNVYITEDDETVTLFSDNQNVGNASSFDFSEIEAGRTYNFAVTAVMEGDDGLFVESPLSNIINFSHISPDENNLPRIETTDLPNYTDACTVYSETITSSDVDSEDILTLSLAIAPEGMTLSENTISWRPTVEQLGQNQVVFEVNDGNGGIVQKQLIIAVLEVDDEEPTPSLETLEDIVAECSVSLTAPTATDSCSGTITATTEDAMEYTEQGDYIVTWTYTDEVGNTVEQTQNVMILDTLEPEVLTQNISVVLDEMGSVNITATQIDAGSSDNCSLQDLTLDVTSFSCDDLGENTVMLTATDAVGNISSGMAVVTVEDFTAPVFNQDTLPEDTTRGADLNNEYNLEDFTAGITFEENCIATISQSPEIGTTFTPGTYDITLTVIDMGGNEDLYTFELTVEDHVLGIAEVNSINFSLYPNPTKTYIMVTNPDNVQIQNIQVFDLSGKQVKTLSVNSFNSEIRIETSNLAKGMYLLKINSSTGQVVKTLLKE